MNEKRNAASRVMTHSVGAAHPWLLRAFEQAVAHILSVVISVIIAISLCNSSRGRRTARGKALTPLITLCSRRVFGMIMTLLIAMEFKHSIYPRHASRDHIVQVKTVC